MSVAEREPVRKLVVDFDAVVADRRDVDRDDVFARLRADLPVFFSERLDSWVVSRYEDVRRILEDEVRFEPLREGPGAPVFGRSFLQMSGREHNKKVGIVARRIRTPRSLKEQLDGLVEQIARRQAAALPLGETIDLRERYAMWIPLLAITELMALPEAARFRDWYRAMAAGGVTSIADPSLREAAFRARAEVEEFLVPIIEERRRSPGTDLVSDLVTAEYEGEPLPHDEIVSTVIFLLTAGVETTERVLTSVLRHLALDREEWQALRARRGDPTALAAFSAEALRVFPPVNGLTRLAREPLEIAGSAIAEGARVCVLLGSANRDEARFPDPDRFDRDRFAVKPDNQFATAGDILSFGAGGHHCTGSRLAAVEMVHALSRLLDRVEVLEPAGELPPPEGFILRSPPALPVVLHGA
jgi:pulcherriminic acid synthase